MRSIANQTTAAQAVARWFSARRQKHGIENGNRRAMM
jgi:hypothetical protein